MLRFGSSGTGGTGGIAGRLERLLVECNRPLTRFGSGSKSSISSSTVPRGIVADVEVESERGMWFERGVMLPLPNSMKSFELFDSVCPFARFSESPRERLTEMDDWLAPTELTRMPVPRRGAAGGSSPLLTLLGPYELGPIELMDGFVSVEWVSVVGVCGPSRRVGRV